MIEILLEHIHDLKNCQKLSASVDAFAENVTVTNLVPGVLSRGCVSEYTTQEPFGNNELCCFDIGP